jgi:hypothetical protein
MEMNETFGAINRNSGQAKMALVQTHVFKGGLDGGQHRMACPGHFKERIHGPVHFMVNRESSDFL